MSALAQRTKIKGEIGLPASTTSLTCIPDEYDFPIVAAGILGRGNFIGHGSIRLQTQQVFPDLSPRAKEVLFKVYSFVRLSNNWDNNNSIAPNQTTVDATATFLKESDEYDLPIYFTAPGPNGEIVLEYKSGSLEAEVFFENDGSTEMILYIDGQQVYTGIPSLHLLLDHFISPAKAIHVC